MRNACIILVAVGLMCLAVSAARASTLTYSFDPDDLIQLAPASAGDENIVGENKATQENARRVHVTWGGTWYETFYNPVSPQPQPNSYNTYMNWRDGLGANEGISSFNIWLLDNPNAQSWGESTVWDPNGPAPTATADAAGKWQAQVIANPWGPGWLAQWWTEDSADYINAASAIGDFSFSGVAYHDANANGYDATDPEVAAGDVIRVWFGAVNYDLDWSLHFDGTGWGARTPPDPSIIFSDGLSAGYGSGYEGVLDIEAVPEPLSMIFFGTGIVGVFGFVARRRMRA